MESKPAPKLSDMPGCNMYVMNRVHSRCHRGASGRSYHQALMRPAWCAPVCLRLQHGLRRNRATGTARLVPPPPAPSSHAWYSSCECTRMARHAMRCLRPALTVAGCCWGSSAWALEETGDGRPRCNALLLHLLQTERRTRGAMKQCRCCLQGNALVKLAHLPHACVDAPVLSLLIERRNKRSRA